MPKFEQNLAEVSEAPFYATFELIYGYRQQYLHKGSSKLKYFIEPDGMLSPTRVLHGTSSTVLYLQSTVSYEIPANLRSSAFVWLDGVMLHKSTVDCLLSSI